MTSGLIYILQALMNIYLLALTLRLAMQWVRSDYRNPIVKFVLTITDPIVLPLRKIIPPAGRIDIAAIIAFYAILVIFGFILLQLICQAMPDIASLLIVSVIRGIYLIFSVYLYLIFGYIILSWVTMAGGGGYNPALATLSNLLSGLVEPVLAPFRKVIPAIGGFDLSPIALLILIGAVRVTLISIAGEFNTMTCPVTILM